MKKLLFLLTIACLFSCKEQKAYPEIEFESNQETTINASSIFDNVSLSNVKLKCRGFNTRAADVFGSGVTIYFTIENKSNIGIKKVFFNGSFKFENRTYTYSDDINYTFPKGLEPNEVKEIAMRPSIFSEWNNVISPGDKGSFVLSMLEIEDYNGTISTH